MTTATKTNPRISSHNRGCDISNGCRCQRRYYNSKRRYPLVKVIVLPALVQGENASRSIVTRIEEANEKEICDVLIVGRGGGSIEELWAFNEEIVARAIFASNIPIISAVGHETDLRSVILSPISEPRRRQEQLRLLCLIPLI